MSFATLLATGDVAIRDVLGQDDVTYSPSVGASAEVAGVFDDAYVRTEAGQPGVVSSGPAVFLALDDLPSDPRTDLTATVTIDGTEYSIHEAKADGLGGVLLHLHKV